MTSNKVGNATSAASRMSASLRRRFWIEVALGSATGVVFLVTLVWRTWIETVFGVDPDQGNGTVEWLIVVALGLVTVVSVALARAEWNHTGRLTVEV
jgi:hypothetical protein